MLTTAAIKAKACELGFDACGVAPAVDLPELPFFREWLDRGYAGDMSYLARSAARRADVRQVLPSAKTVIVTATNYNTDRPYSTECREAGPRAHRAVRLGRRLSRGDPRRMESLLAWMRTTSDEPFEARPYVDTGPVQERVYARHAGIGWIGKNTCVISPTIGSWTLLAEIICSLPLDVDEPGVRPVRRLYAVSRGLSDPGAGGARSARCHALRVVSDDRAAKRHSRFAAARRRDARLRL